MFINNFVRGQRHKRFLSSLLNIKQGENESLQSFISRFNREALLVDEMYDKILLAAFHNRVTSNLFIHELYDRKTQTMAELIHSTQSFMNVEDAITANRRKRLNKQIWSIHVIQNKDPVQRRLGWEKRETGTARR